MSNGYPSSFLKKVTKTILAIEREEQNHIAVAVLPYVEIMKVFHNHYDVAFKGTVFEPSLNQTTLRKHLVRAKDSPERQTRRGCVYDPLE